MTKLRGLLLSSTAAGRLAGLIKMRVPCCQFLGRMPGRLWSAEPLFRREPIVPEVVNQDRRSGPICAFLEREGASNSR